MPNPSTRSKHTSKLVSSKQNPVIKSQSQTGSYTQRERERGRRMSSPHKQLNPPDPSSASDPLLSSGAFIDATTGPMENGNGAEPPAAAADGSSGRVKDTMNMDWLPPGWTVEYKVRTSGATAGSTDRYYHDPVSGRRFRSKKEVRHFLETGTLKKNSNEKPSVDISPSKRQKKSGTKSKPEVNFDFFDVPTEVEWVLTDSSQWSWTPFIAGRKVAESTAQEWASAFAVFTSKNSGRTQ